MAITISYADYQFHPDEVLGYEFSRASRNVIHDVLAPGDPVVTLRAAMPRSGTLSLFFRDKSAALDAEDAHALAEVFALADTDHPDLGMRYVLSGDLHLTQDKETMRRWVLEVPFQELP